jgi:hypothetical protein
MSKVWYEGNEGFNFFIRRTGWIELETNEISQFVKPLYHVELIWLSLKFRLSPCMSQATERRDIVAKLFDLTQRPRNAHA